MRTTLPLPVLDLEAIRQWADHPLPTDRSKWPALMNQIRSDVIACCDHIDELEQQLKAIGTPGGAA